MMTKRLADRIALVTGASRGIGAATALALGRAGAHVVAVARTVGGLEEIDDAIRADASETESTPVRVNLLNPGPIRTRMRAQAMPGEDPATLDKPHQVAEKILELCLPNFVQTGKLYDYRTKTLMDFRPPAPEDRT